MSAMSKRGRPADAGRWSTSAGATEMVQWALGARKHRLRYAHVPRCRVDALVPEQYLDDAQVRPGLKEMRREAVSQNVRSHFAVSQSRTRRREMERPPRHDRSEPLTGMTCEEERRRWAFLPPILAEKRQEPWAEHDVAVPVALPQAHVDHSSLGVDISSLERAGFSDAEARCVDGGEEHAKLHQLERLEDLLDLLCADYRRDP